MRCILAVLGLYLPVFQSLNAVDLGNWNLHSTGITHHLASVAYGNRTFVVVGGRGIILRAASDGAWITCDSGTTNDLSDVCWGEDQFVAIGVGGTILRSSDGVDWTASSSPVTETINCITFGNDTYVALTKDRALTSRDGRDWTVDPLGATTLPPLPVPYPGQSVCFGNGRFVAAGEWNLLESLDGRTWRRWIQSTNVYHDVAYADGRFIAVGETIVRMTLSPAILSAFGTVEQGRTLPALGSGGGVLNSLLKGVAYGDGVIVVVGGVNYSASPYFVGNIFVSATGENPWEDQNPVLAVWPPDTKFNVQHILRAVAYGSGKFVAVGDSGTIVESGRMFRLVAPEQLSEPSGHFHFRIQSEPGAQFRVSTSTDLKTWSHGATRTNLTGTVDLEETVLPGAATKFFRAELINP